jgi:hypothetical protein
MRIKSVPGLLALTLLAASCKTAKPIRPVESYEERFEDKTSVLQLPVEIEVAELERTLNAQLSGVVYEDNSFTDGDDMTLRATKRDLIRIQLDGMTLRYKTPLNLAIRYNTGVGKIDADGAIELEFRTDLSLNTNWSLQTVTTLEGYRWLETPRLRLGAISIPVSTIANYVLKRTQATLAAGIDEEIKESFQLERYIDQAWRMMFQPYEMSAEYKAWLTVNPVRMGMTPLDTRNGRIRSTVVVEARPDLAFGPRPSVGFVPALPPFSFQALNTNQEFVVYVNSLITFEEAQRLARQSVQGMRFEQGNRHVEVKDIELYGQGDQMVVNLTLDGSYKGNIYLLGRPTFNPATNTVDIKDIEYTLDTRNFLAKSAAWLLKSTLKNKIQENFDFLLQYNLQDLRRQIQSNLNNYRMGQGIFIDGELHDLSLFNAYLTTTGIKVSVALRGDVEVKIQALN